MLLNYEIIYDNKIISVILLILLSICFWYAFDFLLPGKVSVHECEKHSFWVFALHINVGAVVTKLLYIVLPKNSGICFLNFALTTVLTLGFIEIACYIVKKISPRGYAILSGYR